MYKRNAMLLPFRHIKSQFWYTHEEEKTSETQQLQKSIKDQTIRGTPPWSYDIAPLTKENIYCILIICTIEYIQIIYSKTIY